MLCSEKRPLKISVPSKMIQSQLAYNQSTKCEPLESEIDLMAKQIIEQNKEKQLKLLDCTPAHNKPQRVEVREPQPTEILSKDRASIEGKFGWTRFDQKFIPYLFRYEKKYVARHMMECNVFCKYYRIFNKEIYSCFKVEEYKMTAAEAKLLNEINFVHCDNSLGSFIFPDRHYLISLNDAMELAEFLLFCYDKLVLKKEDISKLCGFMRINSQNCIPYVWLEYKQYVPLFYLDGECQYLEEKSVELKGWELAYMKLLCKIQGIRKPLFDHQSIRVVDLELVKKFFPPGIPFEEFWPIENKIDSLIIYPAQRPSLQNNNQENNPKKVQADDPQSLQVEKSTTNAGKNSSSKCPPKTVKVPNARTSPYSTTNTPVRTTKKNSKICNSTKPSPQRMETSSKVNSIPPPPPYPGSVVSSDVSSAVNLKTPLGSYKFSDNTYNTYNTYQVPGYVHKDNEYTYFLVRSQVGDTILNYCINSSPRNSADLLATVEEIAENLFKISSNLLAYTINSLQIKVYFPNTLQMKVFLEHKLYPAKGLIKLSDLLDNIGRIKMFLNLI